MLVLHTLFHLIPPKFKGVCAQWQDHDSNTALNPKFWITVQFSLNTSGTWQKYRFAKKKRNLFLTIYSSGVYWVPNMGPGYTMKIKLHFLSLGSLTETDMKTKNCNMIWPVLTEIVKRNNINPRRRELSILQWRKSHLEKF